MGLVILAEEAAASFAPPALTPLPQVTWCRVESAPGVELCVRSDVEQRYPGRAQRLTECCQEIVAVERDHHEVPTQW